MRTLITRTFHTESKRGDAIEPLIKVNWCSSITSRMWTPIFEWCVFGCGFENRHINGIMCLKRIGLHAQNMLTILGPIVKIIEGDLYDHQMSMGSLL